MLEYSLVFLGKKFRYGQDLWQFQDFDPVSSGVRELEPAGASPRPFLGFAQIPIPNPRIPPLLGKFAMRNLFFFKFTLVNP